MSSILYCSIEYNLAMKILYSRSFVAAVEFGIDGSINVETVGNATVVQISSSTIDENKVGCISFNPKLQHMHSIMHMLHVLDSSYVLSKLSRPRRDGTNIGRALVCNREGYRMPDKREKIVRQRAETRVGCRAMILVRKVSSGKWVITKFIMEHTHPLTPGKGRRDCIYEQYPVS